MRVGLVSMNGQARNPPLRFEHGSLGTLHPFQRTADGIRLSAQNLQLRPDAEIVAGLIGATEAAERETAEIVSPWVAAAAAKSTAYQARASSIGESITTPVEKPRFVSYSLPA